MTTKVYITKKECFLFLGFIAFVGASYHLDKEGNLPSKSVEFLKNHHYKSIEIGEQYNWCPSKTKIRREFTAINPKGQKVEGFICAESKYHPDKIETKLVSSKKPTKI